MLRVLEKPDMDFLNEEVQQYEQEYGTVVQALPDPVSIGCPYTCYGGCDGSCGSDCTGRVH